IWRQWEVVRGDEKRCRREVMKRMGRGAALCAVLVLGIAVQAQAQGGVEYAAAPAGGEYEDAIRQARLAIDSLMRANNVPGVSIAVSVGGQVVWSEGFGYANVEQQTPVTPTTKFRIGSISKPLTAAAMGLLYERGKLDLDAPVQRYVPQFPEKAKGTITPRLLAGHLAGVRHYLPDGSDNFLTKRYENVEDALEIFADDTLNFVPGSKYQYSSYGWNLLSVVVQSAAGERYLDYMRENVFRPLGMRNTVADHTDSIIVGRTGFYVRTPGGFVVNAPYVDNSYKWAGGGFLSTPEDLLRFAHAHMYGGLLKRETVELWWTPQVTTTGDTTSYGIGWSSGEWEGHRWVGHGGGSVGGNCRLVIFPAEKVVVAITTNITGAGLRRIPERIAGMFMN
ncbi:MAG: serine hydrolase domain-containing protein, partial [Gemmatimonadales bacterium]